MKWYIGIRTAQGAHVWVEEDGVRSPLKHLVFLSPTGMEWGYGGSGPADLAMSLIADAAPEYAYEGQRPAVDPGIYMGFKRDIVIFLPRDGWRISAQDIRRWIEVWLSDDGEDAARRHAIVQVHPLLAEGGIEGEPE
jgi:hypothetical protein